MLRYCGRLALALTGREKPPSVVEQGRALAATDRLIEVARSKPAAAVEGGADMRRAPASISAWSRIDQALATLPYQP